MRAIVQGLVVASAVVRFVRVVMLKRCECRDVRALLESRVCAEVASYDPCILLVCTLNEHVQDITGWTMLHIACLNNHVGIVNELLVRLRTREHTDV